MQDFKAKTRYAYRIDQDGDTRFMGEVEAPCEGAAVRAARDRHDLLGPVALEQNTVAVRRIKDESEKEIPTCTGCGLETWALVWQDANSRQCEGCRAAAKERWDTGIEAGCGRQH